MDRLTERTSDGILVKEDFGENVLKTLYQCYGAEPMPHYANCDEGYCAIEKLAEYEDFEEIFCSKMTDVSCDFLKDKEEFAKWLDRNKWIAKKCDEYVRAEEQGKLLKLPCAVGDRVYRIDTDEKIENREIEVYEIDNIVILSGGTILLKYDAYDGVICEIENIITDKLYLDFYGCFLTKKEAEAALKEL